MSRKGDRERMEGESGKGGRRDRGGRKEEEDGGKSRSKRQKGKGRGEGERMERENGGGESTQLSHNARSSHYNPLSINIRKERSLWPLSYLMHATN